MMVRVYVAAPYLDAPLVRGLEPALVAMGAQLSAAWAKSADGPERLDAMPHATVRALAERNDRELLEAHVLLALAREGAGGEMFAEVRLALDSGIPVLWTGARGTLSAFREGVMRTRSLEEALDALESMAELVRRPWVTDDDWVRQMIWATIEHLEGGAA